MKSFISWMGKLPKWGKILFALPMLDIIWVIYRLARSIDKNNTFGIILTVIMIIIGIPFLWLVDIISIACTDNVLWFD